MEHGTFKSSNRKDEVAYYWQDPEVKPWAVLQVAHGMAEHFGRYRHVVDAMNREGVAVWGNDHLGHGWTAGSREDLGYFAEEEGWYHMVEDLYGTTLRIREAYSDLPIFLLGHSMGSLLARSYATRYGEDVQGMILTGTSGPNVKTTLATPVVQLIKQIKGPRHRSKLLYALAFGNYNATYGKGSDRLGWMSQDPEVLAAFRQDPRCNFILTVSGFSDLMHLLNEVNQKEWAFDVPKNLPIFLLSGEQDPVGEYGSGVRRVWESLMEAKHRNFAVKLYPKTRHEILHGPVGSRVIEDILQFMKVELDKLTK